MNTKKPADNTLSHLIELRRRLLYMLYGIILCALPCIYFSQTLYQWLARPLLYYLPENASMIATAVTTPFLTPFKLSLLTAIVISMPWLIYQLWRFIAPALYRRERRWVLSLVFLSSLLFYMGMLFAYFVVFPLVFRFFVNVTPVGVSMMTDIALYLQFVTKLLFAFGLAFQLPVIITLLITSQITSIARLKTLRPYIILGCFIAAMLLTPPDVISQILLAVPLWLLFESSLLLARLVQNK